MGARFAVFDFSEVNAAVFSGNDVDLVEVGFVVAFDNGVAALF